MLLTLHRLLKASQSLSALRCIASYIHCNVTRNCTTYQATARLSLRCNDQSNGRPRRTGRCLSITVLSLNPKEYIASEDDELLRQMKSRTRNIVAYLSDLKTCRTWTRLHDHLVSPFKRKLYFSRVEVSLSFGRDYISRQFTGDVGNIRTLFGKCTQNTIYQTW